MAGRSHTKARRRERQRQEAKRLASLKRAYRTGRLTAEVYEQLTGRRPA